MEGEGCAVLNSGFAHEAGHVGFDGGFIDVEGGGDFAVGAAGDQEGQYLGLAGCQLKLTGWFGWDSEEAGHDLARGPDGAVLNDGEGHAEFGLGSEIGEVALGAGADDVLDMFQASLRAKDDQAQFGSRSLEGAKQFEEVGDGTGVDKDDLEADGVQEVERGEFDHQGRLVAGGLDTENRLQTEDAQRVGGDDSDASGSRSCCIVSFWRCGHGGASHGKRMADATGKS